METDVCRPSCEPDTLLMVAGLGAGSRCPSQVSWDHVYFSVSGHMPEPLSEVCKEPCTCSCVTFSGRDPAEPAVLLSLSPRAAGKPGHKLWVPCLPAFMHSFCVLDALVHLHCELQAVKIRTHCGEAKVPSHLSFFLRVQPHSLPLERCNDTCESWRQLHCGVFCGAYVRELPQCMGTGLTLFRRNKLATSK